MRKFLPTVFVAVVSCLGDFQYGTPKPQKQVSFAETAAEAIQLKLRLKPTPAGGGGNLLTVEDLTFDGWVAMSAIGDTAGEEMPFSEGAIAVRREGGETRLMVPGGSGYGSELMEHVFTTAYADPTTAYANRMSRSRFWGDVWDCAGSSTCTSGVLRLTTEETGGSTPVIRGLWYDTNENKIIAAYGDNYAAGGAHQTSIACSVLNDADGTHDSCGPWRTTTHSQMTRGYIVQKPNGNLAVGAPITSGNSASCWGVCLFEFAVPAASMTPSSRDTTTDYGITTTQLMTTHDLGSPQNRSGDTNWKFCDWECGRTPQTTSASGSIDSATTTTITHTGAGWTTNQWAGYYVRTTSGDGSLWMTRTISSNTSDTLTVGSAFTTATPSGNFIVYPTGNAASPPTGCDGKYDSDLGGYTVAGGNAWTSIDMASGAVWINDGDKEGVLFFGQLARTIPGHSYGGGDTSTHWWYGPNVCAHGQNGSAYSQSTGDTTETMVTGLWIYDPNDLTTDVAVHDINAEIDSDVPAVAGALYQFGGAAYEPETNKLFVTMPMYDSIFCCGAAQPIILVFSVNTTAQPKPTPLFPTLPLLAGLAQFTYGKMRRKWLTAA